MGSCIGGLWSSGFLGLGMVVEVIGGPGGGVELSGGGTWWFCCTQLVEDQGRGVLIIIKIAHCAPVCADYPPLHWGVVAVSGSSLSTTVGVGCLVLWWLVTLVVLHTGTLAGSVAESASRVSLLVG